MGIKREMQIDMIEVGGSFDSTMRTIMLMIQYAKADSINLAIRNLASNIVTQNGIDPRNNRSVADILFFWVKQHIKFVRDPATAEFVQAPHNMILPNVFKGDCDDQSTFLASLNLAVGNIVRFVTIGKTQYCYSHVYLQVLDQNGKWIAYDTVVYNSMPGWEAKQYALKTVWDLSGNYQHMSDENDDRDEYVDNVQGNMRSGDAYIVKYYPGMNREDFPGFDKHSQREFEGKLVRKLEVDLANQI